MLRYLMDTGRVAEFSTCGDFASYPTASIVAVDVELKFHRCHKQAKPVPRSSSETSAEVSVGYGP